MSNELMRLDETMLAAASQYAGQGAESLDVTVTPMIHLCQPMSPEVVESGVAKGGDFFVRGVNLNLGSAFEAVALLGSREWVCWRRREEGGGILWRGRETDLTPEQKAMTLWGDKTPPVANETYNFALVPYGKNGPELQQTVLCSMARSSAKCGKNLMAALKMFCGQKMPVFGARIAFASKKVTNDDGTFYAWTATLNGVVKAEELAGLAQAHGVIKTMMKGHVATQETAATE